ncbi:hypothetical protein [Desulfolutivibrio sp.]|uniref:hypothetical protein n=1 Tax=Desulfolutivibrio sp. TaxID=2773296 RepID=UPI002F96560D
MIRDLLAISAANQQKARAVIEDCGLFPAWESVGATVNLVGSVRTGLLLHRRDIDVHIYSDPFDIAASFAAVARMAEHPRLTRATYANLLQADDTCLEWHAWFTDIQGESWQIDMIHLPPGSRYAGYFETVAERIERALTPETRLAILRLKDVIPPEAGVIGIEIYRAVIEGGVRDATDFAAWREAHPRAEIVDWMPGEPA